jgi:hypothetical protein
MIVANDLQVLMNHNIRIPPQPFASASQHTHTTTAMIVANDLQVLMNHNIRIPPQPRS